MERFKPVVRCRICGSDNLTKYLDFGSVPPANSLLKSTACAVETYPIEVNLCRGCFMSQLSVAVNPEVLYKDYVYHSSVSKTFKEHCTNLVHSIVRNFNVKQDDLIIDIASNDGCLLKQFKWSGFNNLVGVEPSSNLTQDYRKNGICPINKFWSFQVAKDYMNYPGDGAKIITAQNVLAHVDDLDNFLHGVHHFLRDDGIFVAEFPHMMRLIENNQVDTIYHEHLSYFLLKPLLHLFNLHGIPIFHVEEIDIHGGSLRIYASKHPYRPSGISDVIGKETIAGCYDELTYSMLNKRVLLVKESLIDTIIRIRKEEKKIIGYGASAKGISLLNYFGINNNHIHSIVDETPDKQDKWTPGGNIPIVDFSHFEKEKPDYVLLLAWNWARPMIDRTSFLKTQYIIPIPDVVIV